MIRQTVLPFKLKRAEEKITARSELILYEEFIRAMGIEKLVNQYIAQTGFREGVGGDLLYKAFFDDSVYNLT